MNTQIKIIGNILKNYNIINNIYLPNRLDTGMNISGLGIPTNTTIISLSTTSIIISNPAILTISNVVLTCTK